MPRSANPGLLVGFETSDDAGVFLLPDGSALVQTMDFFTPIVDDPLAYGRIAAANALSDVYAMGGRPLTVMNIACFDPDTAPPEVWGAVLAGMHEKTQEAGAVVVGGHTVTDKEPKFGLSVTGIVNPDRVWKNDQAKAGDEVWLSKPLGTGIVTTAAKFDQCSPEELTVAVDSMAALNDKARDAAMAVSPPVVCATDVTGFGLAGHLFNVARASGVRVRVRASALPVLPGVERMVVAGCVTAGGSNNRTYLGDRLTFAPSVPAWLRDLVVDPQTSGGLAVFARAPVAGSTLIGEVMAGSPGIDLV